MPEHQQIQQSKKPDTIFQKQATPVVQTPVSNPYSIIQRAKINPKSLTHADIMQLQRTIGNRAVGRLLSGIGNTSTAQQATVQRQEIPEEEKACPSCMQRQEIPEEEPLQGKMIETVQRQEIPEEEEPLQGKMMGTIQRQEIPEEEEPLQGKFENKPEIACPSCFAAPIVQKQETKEEEKTLQGKMIGTIQRQEISEEEKPLQPKKENNTGMPDNLKVGVESLSGINMSDVRVNYNSSKPAEVGALAYTQGTEIHVAPGQEKYLPHEAWHVVQQTQGRVRPTFQMKGVAVNDDVGLENEADAMGARAVVVGHLATPSQLSQDREGLDQANPQRQPVSRLRQKEPLNSLSFLPALTLPAVHVIQALQRKDDVVQLVTDPVNKIEAQQRHRADQQRVYELVNQAAVADVPAAVKPTREKLLKNTAELIRNNFARLIVMSRTHAEPVLRNGNEIGYFDLTVAYPNMGGDYNISQDNHIYMAPENIQGHADHRGEIRFYDPSGVSDENLKTVLIHEMQHQADFHNEGEGYCQPAIDENAGTGAVNGYQTEFRAYWLGGIFRERKHLGNSYDSLGFSSMPATNERKVPSGSLLKRNFTTAFKNQRQEKIFWHLVGSDSYTYVLTAYQNSAPFRNMVHNFTLPSGGNLLNSGRIDNIRKNILTLSSKINNYYNHIRAVDESKNREEYERILAERGDQIDIAYNILELNCALLDREDLEFLNDRTESAPFWEFAQEKIGGRLTESFYDLIKSRRGSLRHAELLQSLGL